MNILIKYYDSATRQIKFSKKNNSKGVFDDIILGIKLK